MSWRGLLQRRKALAVTLLSVLAGVLVAVCAARAWAQRTPRLHTPAGWPAPSYDMTRNPITADGFALGRRLFYDPQLSQDDTISCASCHQQFAAFAHFDHRVSHGLRGANGTRNAPGLFNLAWQRDFMWDGAVTHLELQPLAPLTNPAEMGETPDGVLKKLRSDADYPRLFARAFGPAAAGEQTVDAPRMLRALGQFLAAMVSADSRYDRHLAGKEAFTASEARGQALFDAHCSAGHSGPLFSDHAYRSDGLPGSNDPGRARISGRDADRGLFRVPSLRNVALTSPYMHDGRYDTLEEVLQHYQHDIPADAADPLLREARGLGDGDAADIIAFLGTLSDESFIHDPRFSEAAAR